MSSVYGAAIPPLTPSYSGLAGGDAAPATPAACTTNATSSSDVGSYTISCSGAADSNYGPINYTTGTLTVVPAPLTVHAPMATFQYGAPVPPTFGPTYTGLVGGDTAPATPPTCTSPAHSGSDVGTYLITCSGAADANYGPIDYTPGTLTITRAATSLSASPLLLSLLHPSARVVRTDNGAPVSGQTVDFRTRAGEVCTDVTDANGRATCSRITLRVGFTATFAGTANYAGSSDSDGLL
jgi:hypothetical protein